MSECMPLSGVLLIIEGEGIGGASDSVSVNGVYVICEVECVCIGAHSSHFFNSFLTFFSFLFTGAFFFLIQLFLLLSCSFFFIFSTTSSDSTPVFRFFSLSPSPSVSKLPGSFLSLSACSLLLSLSILSLGSFSLFF